MATQNWKKMMPSVLVPKGSAPPVCSRESVYIPEADVFLTCSPASERQASSEMWVYKIDKNAWYRIQIPFDSETDAIRRAHENRALVYDPQHGLVLLLLGGDGDEGKVSVYALKYRDGFGMD
jgi:hypothetical protein